MPPAKKALPTLDISAPATETLGAPQEVEIAQDAETIAAAEVTAGPVATVSLEDAAYAALIGLGYDEETALGIASRAVAATPGADGVRLVDDRRTGGAICSACFPEGWARVKGDGNRASCAHAPDGGWSRVVESE